jgi:hypothetical protein
MHFLIENLFLFSLLQPCSTSSHANSYICISLLNSYANIRNKFVIKKEKSKFLENFLPILSFFFELFIENLGVLPERKNCIKLFKMKKYACNCLLLAFSFGVGKRFVLFMLGLPLLLKSHCAVFNNDSYHLTSSR